MTGPARDEVLDRALGSLEWRILCPTCGESNMDRVGEKDHDAVTLHPDRDEYDSPIRTRGGYLRVELRCSGGHQHALILANHKGEERLALIPSDCPVPASWP